MEALTDQIQSPTGKDRSRETTVKVLRDFMTTYCDAIHPNSTGERWPLAARVRRLVWKSEHRVTLADAVWCYGLFSGGYNEFQPDMLTDLQHSFPEDGIQVTPAREYSVAVYLHVPNKKDLRKRIETFANEHFKADDVQWVTPGTLRCWWD